jgi:hypothetical protein
LCRLRAAGDLTAEHVRLAAAGLKLSERSIWRLLSDGTGGTTRPRGPAPYELSDTDREAYAHYGANIAAVHRARTAVLDSWRQDHLDAEQALKDSGLLHSQNGPHRVSLDDDVRSNLDHWPSAPPGFASRA